MLVAKIPHILTSKDREIRWLAAIKRPVGFCQTSSTAYLVRNVLWQPMRQYGSKYLPDCGIVTHGTHL